MPNVDEIFKDGLGNHEMSPGATGWERLSKALISKEGKVLMPWYYNPKKAMIGALLVSLFSFTIGYFIAQAYSNSKIETETALKSSSQDILINRGTQKSRSVAFHNPKNKLYSNYFLAVKNKNSKKSDKKQVKSLNGNSKLKDSNSSSGNASGGVRKENLKDFSLFLTPSLELAKILTQGINYGVRSINFTLPTNDNKVFARDFNNTLLFSQTRFSNIDNTWSAMNEGLSVDEFNSEVLQSSSTNYTLQLNHRISKHFELTLGLGIDQHSTVVSGQRIAYDKDETGMNLENRDVVSKLDYTRTYNALASYIPVGLRFGARKWFLAYHIEAGGFFQSKINEHRQLNFSDERFLPLANNWESEVYSSAAQFGLYSNLGIDAFVTQNIGFSFDAIIRKRMQPKISSHNLDGQLYAAGLRLGVFCKF